MNNRRLIDWSSQTLVRYSLLNKMPEHFNQRVKKKKKTKQVVLEKKKIYVLSSNGLTGAHVQP